MRKTDIGHKVLDLIDGERLEEAVQLFAKECGDLEHCLFIENVHNCVKLCLLPKLNYLSLRAGDKIWDERIKKAQIYLDK